MVPRGNMSGLWSFQRNHYDGHVHPDVATDVVRMGEFSLRNTAKHREPATFSRAGTGCEGARCSCASQMVPQQDLKTADMQVCVVVVTSRRQLVCNDMQRAGCQVCVRLRLVAGPLLWPWGGHSQVARRKGPVCERTRHISRGHRGSQEEV